MDHVEVVQSALSRIRVGTKVALAVVGALSLSGCVPTDDAVGLPSPSPSATVGSQISATPQEELAEECVGNAEIGTVAADVCHARVAQRSDGTWLVSVPMTFEALRNGEQHCVIADESGDLVRIAVESGEAWTDGEFESWLESDELWYE